MRLNENCGYISQPKVQMLMENVWKKRLDIIESAVGELSDERKAATAVCLENTKELIRHQESIGATQSRDIGQFKRFALDMIGAIVPNLLTYDIASVQAIDSRIAMINYMKYNYGTPKGAGGFSIGDVRNFGVADENYTSEVITGEPVLDNDTSGTSKAFTLNWTPVTPGSFVFRANDGAADFTLVDDGAEALAVLSGTTYANFSAGTINYVTGEVTITLSSAKTLTATVDYKYNNEHVPAKNIPSITLSIESLPIQARARRLAAVWGFEASYELQKEYGQSIEELLSRTAAGEISHEIDLEVMRGIRNAAANSPDLVFSTVAPVGVSLQDHFDALAIKFNEGSSKIYQATRRIRPNYIICGTNVATVIQSIRIFKPSAETVVGGPYFAGVLGPYRVYVSPDFNPDEFVMGYKGDTLLDAGFVYAPYMPIATTSMIQLEDMAGRKGWATMYGTRVVNDKMFIRGSIVRS
jgi:hypothetical protein